MRLTGYWFWPILLNMKLAKFYQCFCDETRLRILNLLTEGPLCVCHLTAILGVPQPKVSRHLKALREAGALQTERCYNWTIYYLPEEPPMAVQINLKYLRSARAEEPAFRADLKKRAAIVERIASGSEGNVPEQIKIIASACC